MALLTKIGKVAVPLTGAVFIEPLLNFFAPSVKPLIRQFIQSDATKEFLKDLAEGATQAGSGLCTEFLANRAEELLGALKKNSKLDEVLIIALRSALGNMRDDLRRRNQHNTLNSFDQFFADWDEKLKQIQEDEFDRKELLETKQYASLFYEWPNTQVEEKAWWEPITSELKAWTKYQSIPSTLEDYLKENLLVFADNALTSTLNREEYKEAWNEFQKTLGAQILSTLRELGAYILELKELAKLASGQFIRDKQTIEFPLRRIVDSLVNDLSGKEIYIHREPIVVGENLKLTGLKDIAASDGYFLLAAPAGSGKSTLMARWVREFALLLQSSGNQPMPEVCYYFYNKQEGTNDHNKALAVLGDQLLKAHHIQANVNSFNPATIDSIIPVSLELPHPVKLLVIVDGLDEAGEPSSATDFLSLFKRIFPKHLGKNTTVILTIRDDEGSNSLEHYRRELGLPLTAIQVPEVSTDSLASYLSSSRYDKLKVNAADEDLLRQIIAKTEGLAIYVHYLLDELCQTDEAHWTEVIATLPKGFERYVSASLPAALNGNPVWEDALSFLSLATTPLGEQDLIALTKLSGNKLKVADFDRVKWNIKRWLRSENNSWAFSHQKIGEVFYELYVAKERLTYLEPLMTYCADWKQNMSRYVLQNYADLLRKEQKEDELYELASNKDFLNSQRGVLTDHPNSPLHTLQTAIMYAADRGNAAMMARYSLACASMSKEIAGEAWYEAYYRRGYLSALQLADHLNNRQRRVIWYILIARELVASYKQKEAEYVLNRLDASPFPKLPSQIYLAAESALLDLLQTLTFTLVIRIYTKALPKQEASRNLVVTSTYLAQIGDFDKAGQIAHHIEDPKFRAHALIIIATALARAQRWDEAKELIGRAEQTIDSIGDPVSRSQLLGNMAVAIMYTGNVEEAKSFFAQAVQTARSVESPNSRFSPLGNIAKSLTVAGLFEEAKELFAEAEQVLLSASNHAPYSPVESSTAFLVNVKNIEESNKTLDEAVRAARSIKNPIVRAQALGSIAKDLAADGKSQEAEEIFDEAEQAARSIEDLNLRRQVLVSLVSSLAHPQLLDKAKQFIQSAKGPGGVYPRFLIRLANALATNQYFNEALIITRDIEDLLSRPRALTDIALAYAGVGRTEEASGIFDESIGVARSIRAFNSRAQALGSIAKDLAAGGKSQEAEEIFDEAKQAARSINNSVSRAQELINIAVMCAGIGNVEKAKELLDAAEEEAQSIESLVDCHEIISKLAPALAQIGQFDKARGLLQTINENGLQFLSSSIFAASARMSPPPEVDQFFNKAEDVAEFIEDPKSRAQALCSLAAALARTQHPGEADRLFNQAERVAYSIKDFEPRSEALANIATTLVKARLFQRALIVTKEIQSKLLLLTLDEFAKAQRPEGLKQHIVFLSYETDSALHICTQMLLLYEEQADMIYSEICKYVKT